MSGVDLEFLITASNKGQHRYTIEGIPEKLWDFFMEKSKEALPEKGPTAWSSMICEFLTSNIKSDIFTFMMTDVPTKAREKLQEICTRAGVEIQNVVATLFDGADKGLSDVYFSQSSDEKSFYMVTVSCLSKIALSTFRSVCLQAGMAPDVFLATIFDAAKRDCLHVVSMVDIAEDEKHKTLVITGISNNAWEKWTEIAQTLDVFPEELAAVIFQTAGQGTLKFDKAQQMEEAQMGQEITLQ